MSSGDKVVKGGGIVGKVIKVVDEKEIEIEIEDGVSIRVVSEKLMDVRVKGENVEEKKKK